MHTSIEFLPIIFGIVTAQIFRFTKAFQLRNILLILLNFVGGVLVNWFSKEGIELLIVDVTLACVSSYSFIFLSRFIKKASIPF